MPLRVPFLAVALVLVAAPTFAQVDISGEWGRRIHEDQPHRNPGAELGDYTGLPINAAARQKASSWDASILSLPEHMAKPHPAQYFMRGPGPDMRINKITDPVTQTLIAFTLEGIFGRDDRGIWMDGRPHPPENALHTWSGFSTGQWEGDTLVVTTTHLKEAYIRRTGLMRSDKTTVRTRWRRMGNYLQATVIMYDPVYLSVPYVRSTMMWVFDPAMKMDPYPCEEATETAVPRGQVPHFLPGRSPLPGLDPNLTDRFNTPYQPRLGGAETMYPEYIAKMKTFPKPAKRAAGASEGGQ